MTTRQHLRTLITAAAAIITVLTMTTSCLSDDKIEVVQYNDAAITSFSLGKLNRLMHTTGSKGQDSTYTASVDYSSYLFTIDQEKGLIYNVDSLPKGVMTDKCIPTIGTKNSSFAYLKSISSDSLSYIGTDSLDFSVPRVLRCFANDLSWSKDYTVEVRVHKEEEDSIYWRLKTRGADRTALHAVGQ